MTDTVLSLLTKLKNSCRLGQAKRKTGGSAQWKNLRRLQPVSRKFGLDRGIPIDRHYIEQFLAANSGDIRDRVLEIGDAHYTRQFGGNKVTQSDVLHAESGNDQANLVGDLASGVGIPREAYDCMILTQTLLCIYDLRAAIQNIYTALKPDGVALVTVPGISQISRYDMDRWGDYWRFTNLSVQRLFTESFGEEGLIVKTYGNVLTAVAFLQGIPLEELTEKELDFHDPDYQVTITVRAKRLV